MASSAIHCLNQEKLQFQSSSFEVTDLFCLKMDKLQINDAFSFFLGELRQNLRRAIFFFKMIKKKLKRLCIWISY